MLSQSEVKQLTGVTTKELFALKNILEFNLRGIFLGDRKRVQSMLAIINNEIKERLPQVKQ